MIILNVIVVLVFGYLLMTKDYESKFSYIMDGLFFSVNLALVALYLFP